MSKLVEGYSRRLPNSDVYNILKMAKEDLVIYIDVNSWKVIFTKVVIALSGQGLPVLVKAG